jgi:uncharacterized membrane protein (Fun14 family)
MTLKFKRNIPIVVLLVGILSFMVLTMGSQRIVSYTVNTDALQTIQLTTMTNSFVNLFSAQNTDTALQFNAVQP